MLKSAFSNSFSSTDNMEAACKFVFQGDPGVLLGFLQQFNFDILEEIENDNMFAIYFFNIDEAVIALAILEHLYPPLYFEIYN